MPDPTDRILDRILEVMAEKRIKLSALQKAEDAAGIPKGTKPTPEQLRAVLAALEAL